MKSILSILFVLISFTACNAETNSQNYDKALAFAQNGNYKMALKLWIPLAKNGNRSAQLNIGNMYFNGQGVMKNYKEASKWYVLSAEQGEITAQRNLGVMYYLGNGVNQDKLQSYKWLHKAAKQGDQQSQNNLDILCKESPWACK